MQRGRKTENDGIAVVGKSKDRPAPPDELTDEQAQVWRDHVDWMPADWFPPETHALLAEYCRHVVLSRRVAVAIDGFDIMGDTQEFKRLQSMAREGTASISSVATKLRMTPQSRVHPTTAARKYDNAPDTPSPWEDDDESRPTQH